MTNYNKLTNQNNVSTFNHEGTPDFLAHDLTAVEIFDKLELEVPTATEEQLEVLKSSVNPVRLKNYPVKLTEKTIDMLYRQILKE